MSELTEYQQQVKDGFIRRRGYWSDDWQIVVGLHPEFLAAYTDLSAYAVEHGTLDMATRELIYVATCVSVSHIHAPGIRQHGRNALAAGATPQQLLAVMELASTMGAATVQLVVQQLERDEPGTVARLAAEDGTDAARVHALESEFRRAYDAWDPEAAPALEAVAGYYDALLPMVSLPRHSPDILSPKQVALIMVAVDAMVTNLDPRAVLRDIQAAKAAGATPREVLDVCLQVSGISIHAVTEGVKILQELIAEQAAQQAERSASA